VFESIFMEGSVHKGTIIAINDKGGVVSLPYGVEGFAPKRHLIKEDGSQAKVEDSLEFKVLEFSKENKKIILSHSRLSQEAQAAGKTKETAKERSAERSTKRSVKVLKDSLERTTLGDLEALANLKEEMEKEEGEQSNEAQDNEAKD
ncbi:MAG: S1 RNA-binding domain-containing protein, partial [Bacteroidales bacterium]|nr:S1 RNA-binding domain-containing protein [Bacteroidales bacterium]